MRKSAFKYFIRGNSNVNKGYRKNSKMYFKGVVYYLSYFLLLASLLFAPFALLLNNNLQDDIKENKKFNLANLFNKVDKEKIFNLFFIGLIQAVIIVSGVFVFNFISLQVVPLILMLDSLSNYSNSITIISKWVLYSISFIYGLLVYLSFQFITRLELSLFNNTLKETFTESKKTFKGKSLFKSFVIVLLHLLVILLESLVIYYLIVFLKSEFDLLFVSIFEFIITIIFYGFAFKRLFKIKQSLNLYYDDLIKDSKFLVYSEENIKESKILVNLFDESSLE